MKLYTVTISGYKYYFIGDLSESIIKSIDDFCKSISYSEFSTDFEKVFLSFYSFLCNNTKSTVDPVSIDHIFRINL